MRFSDGKLRRFWRTGSAKGIDSMSVERLQELLSALDAATSPEDMPQPGWDFHSPKGQKKGRTRYAVEVRQLFRLTFESENGEAVRVKHEDYHGK
jgi:proteic killer suppression protein